MLTPLATCMRMTVYCIKKLSQHMMSSCCKSKTWVSTWCHHVANQKIESAHDVIMLQNDLCLLMQTMGEVWNCLLMLISVWFFQLHKKEFSYKENTFCTIQNLTESAKYLGVEIDSKLSFNQHINNTCKKAYSVLGFLRRNFRNFPCKIKADLYST